MNAVAATSSTFHDTMQKDDVVVTLLDGDIPVRRMFERRGQIREFVIMRRKHRAALNFVMQMFGDGPGQ